MRSLPSRMAILAPTAVLLTSLVVVTLPFSASGESSERITSQPKQLQGKAKADDKVSEAAKKRIKQRKKLSKGDDTTGDKVKVTKGSAPKKTKLQDYQEPFYPYMLHTLLGVNILEARSGVVSGAQLGFALGEREPWYLGPEVNFSLYSPGSILQTLLGAWYQLRVYRSPRLSVATGILLGASIPFDFAPVPQAAFTGFFEAVVSQELNDLVSMRGQLRPGFIGSKFAFMMNLNVTFRFR